MQISKCESNVLGKVYKGVVFRASFLFLLHGHSFVWRLSFSLQSSVFQWFSTPTVPHSIVFLYSDAIFHIAVVSVTQLHQLLFFVLI